MGASCGFTRSSCGYVGASDGFQDLTTNMQMDWQFGQALNGNIAVMGEIDVAANREFTIAIALGDGHHAALAGMMQTLATPYDLHCHRFVTQWLRTNSPEDLAHAATDGGRLMRISHNVILAHEDKTYSGAFIASASIPWGASKGDDDLGGYHLVWTRDMVQSATAMLACGRTDTALRALVYLACTQRPDGSFAQNFWIDGTPYWTGIQLDEVAFPIMLAWRLWKLDGLGDFDVFPFVERAAAFLVRYAPVTQQERWEENAGYSPSTLAAVISGLICAADIARAHGSMNSQPSSKATPTGSRPILTSGPPRTEGILHPDVKYHYMRIRPPAVGEPFHNDQIAPGCIHIANRGPDEKYVFEAREIIDAGFLELVRYGIRRADDPLIIDSLKVVDHCPQDRNPLRRLLAPLQPRRLRPAKRWWCLRWLGARPRVATPRAANEPITNSPPVKDVSSFITALERFSSIGGMMPEQIWDHADYPPRECTSAAPPAPPSPSSGHTPNTLNFFVPSPRAASLIASQSSKTGMQSQPPSAPSRARSKSSRSVGQSPASPPDLTLRILDPNPFQAIWTMDNWATTNLTNRKGSRLPRLLR